MGRMEGKARVYPFMEYLIGRSRCDRLLFQRFQASGFHNTSLSFSLRLFLSLSLFPSPYFSLFVSPSSLISSLFYRSFLSIYSSLSHSSFSVCFFSVLFFSLLINFHSAIFSLVGNVLLCISITFWFPPHISLLNPIHWLFQSSRAPSHSQTCSTKACGPISQV